MPSRQRRIRQRHHSVASVSFHAESEGGGKYHFSLRASNYETILTSETCQTKAGAEGGIDSVRRNATDDARYERKTSTGGSSCFTLTATNGQVIGTSEMYSSTTARDNGIKSVKENAPNATVTDRA